MLTTRFSRPVFMASILLVATLAAAQDGEEGLDWKSGPITAQLGSIAQVDLPKGFQFLDGDDTRILMEWLENPTSGHERGTVMPEFSAGEEVPWFVVFEFSPIGYVKDDEKDELDADKILKNLREGNKEANKVRADRGWETLELVGWEIPPYYDPETNNLRWALLLESPGGQSINFSTRILGRQGTMNADLVVSPEDFEASRDGYEDVLDRFSFTKGNSYAEYRPGDKVANYGLTALVAGGVGAVAMKTGLLARFWKFILVGIAAVSGFLKRVVRRLFGRGKASAEQQAPPVVQDAHDAAGAEPEPEIVDAEILNADELDEADRKDRDD